MGDISEEEQMDDAPEKDGWIDDSSDTAGWFVNDLLPEGWMGSNEDEMHDAPKTNKAWL